jgi:predicted ATPase with chaperone activity
MRASASILIAIATNPTPTGQSRAEAVRCLEVPTLNNPLKAEILFYPLMAHRAYLKTRATVN